MLRRAATFLREDPDRAHYGRSCDQDALALAAMLDVLATEIAHLDSGVRWQTVESCRVVLGGTPHVLLLGRPDTHGELHLARRTAERTPTAAAAVAAVLTPQIGPGHPWPEVLPTTHWGRPGPPSVYMQVRPELVVEVGSARLSLTHRVEGGPTA
jgi:hypothetical protein